MAVNRKIYEDFEPQVEWTEEDGCSVITMHLPGFNKEQLQVQVSSTGKLRIFGECHYQNNKWRRFQKEFHIPSNCDASKITAKYKGDKLSVRQPFREELMKPHTEAPKTQSPEKIRTKQKPADSETSIGKPEEGSEIKSTVVSEGKMKSNQERHETAGDHLEDNVGKAGKDTTALANIGSRNTRVAGRFREVILGNSVELTLAILLAVLLFLYAKCQYPAKFVGEPPQ